MAKIDRPNADMPIFGNAAVAGDLKIFGTATDSTDITLLLTNINAEEGWSSGVDSNGFPAKEWFNAVGYTFSYITSYYLQQGVPEWNTNQEYFINAIQVGSNGKLYKSKIDNNSGNNPVSSPTEWEVIGDFDINNLPSKTTVVNGDHFAISDSEDSFAQKKLSWLNIRDTLVTYFDTLYSRTTALFGISQTWVSVTGSRALGVTYTNTTGKPIEILVTASSNAAISYIFCTVDGLVVRGIGEVASSTGGFLSIAMVIPNGSTYNVNVSAGTLVLNAWSELRS